MSRRVTIRGVPDGVAVSTENVSRTRGRSIDATVRRQRLQRYVTWSDEELIEFSEALASLRQVDVEVQVNWVACV